MTPRVRNLLLLGRRTDADALAWKAAVIANGGSVSAGTLSAVNTFVKAAKANSYWSKLNRVNLICGDQLAAAMVPLKVGGGSATETNVNFVGGDYSEATGLTGNGTSKYLNTGLTPTVTFTANDTHIAAYLRANIDLNIGVNNAFDLSLSSGTYSSDQYNQTVGQGRVSAAVASLAGFGVGSRRSLTDHAVYRNGASIGTSATSGGAMSAFPMFLFVMNAAGTPTFYTASVIAGYSVGSGLSAAEVALYYTDIQAFQTALSRNV